jgi:Response regulator containing CheY-like receiver, AAA-type ATPase, and DNA-binding domains
MRPCSKLQGIIKLKKEDPFLEVIILTGHGSIDSAIRSTKQGVFSYLHKPCLLDNLLMF